MRGWSSRGLICAKKSLGGQVYQESFIVVKQHQGEAYPSHLGPSKTHLLSLFLIVKIHKAGDHDHRYSTSWVKQFSAHFSSPKKFYSSPFIIGVINGDEILVQISCHEFGVYDVKKQTIREVDARKHEDAYLSGVFSYSESLLLLKEGTRH